GTYQLIASTTAGGVTIDTGPSNSFLVNPQNYTGSPTLKIDAINGNVTSGKPFSVTVKLVYKGKKKDPTQYDKTATINLELQDANGNILPNGPGIKFAPGAKTGLLPTNGVAKFTGVIINLPTSTTTTYSLVAVMDVNAQLARTPVTVQEVGSHAK